MTNPVPVPVSQFPTASLPLDGTEIIPIVKNGVTSQTTSLALAVLAGVQPEGSLIAAAGNNANVDVSTIRWLFVDTSAGDATITSFVGGEPGQVLLITNQGPNLLGIEGAAIFGLPGLTLPAKASELLYFSDTLSEWVLI